MQFHDVANIFPMMSDEEFSSLKASVLKNGQRVPIYTHEGKIVDGRNRYKACLEIGIAPLFEEWDGDGLLVDFVWDLNAERRELGTGARQMSAGRYAIALEAESKSRQLSGLQNVRSSVQICTDDDFGRSRDKAAEKFGVAPRTVAHAVQVEKSGDDALKRAVESGRASVSAAAEVATLSPEGQAEIVAKGETEILKAAKEIRAKKAQANAQARAEIKAQSLPLPDGQYQCLVIDPPWPIEKIERDERPNQVGFDYPTMMIEELMALPVQALAGDDCHLYLWTTHKFLPDALNLAAAWGFRYQCLMTWVKNVGFTPFSWMYSTEHVLFCRRGSLPLEKMGMRLDFHAKVREHSRKPDEFYNLVAQASPGPRLDMFSRESREGFEQWGFESQKFQEIA